MLPDAGAPARGWRRGAGALGFPWALLLLVWGAGAAQAQQQGPGRNLSFVTRSGSRLLLDGRPQRFSGPNVYWLALDENVFANGSSIHYPTHFRVDDVFATAQEMGALVMRAHTVGVSTGNPLSFEPTLGDFSGSASEHIDYAVFRARMTGIRLIVPLTDNYGYYHGGKHNFVEWASPNDPHLANCRLPLCVKEPEASLCPFYTDPKVIAAFKAYVRALLTHVNQYTGTALKDEPAILGWETGNELNGVPAAWTTEIAGFIRGDLGARQLVLDGIVSGAAPLRPSPPPPTPLPSVALSRAETAARQPARHPRFAALLRVRRYKGPTV